MISKMMRQLAIVAAAATAVVAGVLDECINISLRQEWIVADCLTGQDATTRINSAIYIGNKLVNNDANLQWQPNGGYQTYCRDCRLAGMTYTCSCRPNFFDYRQTSINLEGHISNYGGFLLSNLTHEPVIPSQPSLIPVPASLTYVLHYGTTNCTSPPGPDSYAECGSAVPAPQSSASCDGSGAASTSLSSAQTCYMSRWYSSWEVYTSFQGLQPQADASGAWKYTVYEDVGCAGQPLGQAMEGSCSKFAEFGVGVKVEPLFNGDWQV